MQCSKVSKCKCAFYVKLQMLSIFLLVKNRQTPKVDCSTSLLVLLADIARMIFCLTIFVDDEVKNRLLVAIKAGGNLIAKIPRNQVENKIAVVNGNDANHRMPPIHCSAEHVFPYGISS
jgi:hypothetical protein